MLIPIIALYARDLGATMGMVGLVVGVYSIMNTLGNVVFGRIVDRYGRKRPLIAGLLGDAISMIAYSLCGTPYHLLFVRVFHGTSGALVGPATMSLTADYAGETQRGKTMGLYGISLALATLVGYGLSGVVVTRFSYNTLFYIGCGALLLGVFLAFMLPGDKLSAAGRLRPTLGVEIRKVIDLIKRRNLTASYYSIFAQYFAFGGIAVVFPVYVGSLGMTAAHVGILLTVFGVVFILLQFPSGAFSDRFGCKLPAVAGLLLVSLALCLIPIFTTFTALASVMALYGAGYALLFPAISSLVAGSSAPDERGTATGLFHAFLTAGVAIGAPLIGVIAGFFGTKLALTFSSCATFLGIFIVLALVKDRHSST